MINTTPFSLSLDDTTVSVTMISYRPFKHPLPEHCHGENVFEIHFIPEGYGTLWMDKKKYSLVPNTLFITGPGVFHEQIPDLHKPMKEFGIYFKLNKKHSNGIYINKFYDNYNFFGEASPQLMPLMTHILTEENEKKEGYFDTIPLLLSLFLVECCRCFQTQNYNKILSPSINLVPTTYEVSKKNPTLLMDELFLYEYKNITLTSLSNHLGFSIRQTQRLLMNHYNKTFRQKKLEARMAAAITLLANTPMSITNISEEIGYSSIEHFSSAFSRYYNCSAQDYRKQSLAGVSGPSGPSGTFPF